MGGGSVTAQRSTDMLRMADGSAEAPSSCRRRRGDGRSDDPKIETVIENYEATAGHYRTWPGPNSNTFVAAILRAVPSWELPCPRPRLERISSPVFLGLTDSRTGVEAGLWDFLG